MIENYHKLLHVASEFSSLQYIIILGSNGARKMHFITPLPKRDLDTMRTVLSGRTEYTLMKHTRDISLCNTTLVFGVVDVIECSYSSSVVSIFITL